MIKIDEYITEKLKLDNNIRLFKNPFDNTNFDNTYDVLDYIVEKMDNGGCGSPDIWNDTGYWTTRTDFDDDDWVEAFGEKTNHKQIAIWNVLKNKEANVETNPIVKYFKSSYNKEILYKNGTEVVRYWGPFEYGKHIYVSMLEGPKMENNGIKIICFVLSKTK